MPRSAADWLKALQGLGIEQPTRIMNVCGGHERSISVAGLRTIIPNTIELVPGPGCPVCICPEEDVYEAIQLALNEDVILVAFGDMLRVPVNVPKGEVRSLVRAGNGTGSDAGIAGIPGHRADFSVDRHVFHNWDDAMYGQIDTLAIGDRGR